ncbi:serine hydrolase [Silanimonas sp.]|jgi:hypothetical protein|uniref:serine hydrolase n=1 Tax=Silanimonas sp. TaxID=1929290 RepID=UPI0037CB1BA7
MDEARRRVVAAMSALGLLSAAGPALAQSAPAAAAGARRHRRLQGAEAQALFDAVFVHLPAAQREVLRDPRREVQIALTRIEREADGSARFATATFGVQRQRWFPAASVVKLPIALLVAEVLEAANLGFNARTVLSGAPRSGNWEAAEPSVEPLWQTLWRLLVVSENVPFNRLYDVLGPDRIHARLAELGFGDVRLISRLGSPDPRLNRQTVALRIEAPETGPDGELAWVPRWNADARRGAARRFPFGSALKGAAWQDDRGRIEQGPRDFSTANFLPLEDAHAMLLRLAFPEATRRSQRWALSATTRLSLLRITGLFPRESPLLATGTHAPAAFGDGYAKFFVVGDRDAAPRGFRSFGKTGEAFGHQGETALLTEADGQCEVLLSANLYANDDGVLNDDRYEYDTVSRPFLAALGRAALAAEKERPRPHRAGAAFLPSVLGLG